MPMAKKLHPRPKGLEVGQTIVSGRGAAPKRATACTWPKFHWAHFIHNIEMQPRRQGGKLVRSAGNSALMMGREDRYAVVAYAFR
jgi:large subunit ribosomal protein L2